MPLVVVVAGQLVLQVLCHHLNIKIPSVCVLSIPLLRIAFFSNKKNATNIIPGQYGTLNNKDTGTVRSCKFDTTLRKAFFLLKTSVLVILGDQLYNFLKCPVTE